MIERNPSKARRTAAGVALACCLAAPFEGLRQYAYLDPVGIPTNCFGTTRGVKLGDYKTLDECKAIMSEEMTEAVAVVDKCVPDDVPLTVNQLAAFGSAVYNIGPAIVCDPRKSTAARLLRDAKVMDACAQLPRWDKATKAGVLITLPGLTKRRQAEYKLCITPA